MDRHGQGHGLGGEVPRSELEQFMMQGGMPQGYDEARNTVHAQYVLDNVIDDVEHRFEAIASDELDGDYAIDANGCHGEKEWERGWSGDRYLAHARITLEPRHAGDEPVDVHWYQTKAQQPGMYVLGMEVESLDEEAAKTVDEYVHTLVEPFSVTQDMF